MRSLFAGRGVDVVISVSVTHLGQYAYLAARDA